MLEDRTDDLRETRDVKVRVDDVGEARFVSLGRGRKYGTVTAHYIGSAVIAQYVNYNSTGGFYLRSIGLPGDLDAGEACSVRILVNPLYDASVNGQVIRFYLQWTYVDNDGAIHTDSFNFDWDVPDDWTTGDVADVLLDNGNGVSIDAGYFDGNGGWLGFKLARVGSAAEDTFNKAVRIAEGVEFHYVAK